MSFFLHIHMHDAAYISSITSNSISGLDIRQLIGLLVLGQLSHSCQGVESSTFSSGILQYDTIMFGEGVEEKNL